jgi:tetratricopeptide (TPR) repeat protein
LKPTAYIKTIAFAIIILFASSINVSGQLNKLYFYNLARNFIAEDKFAEAINSLNTLISSDSTIADAWFLRGVAKYHLDDLHGANADLTKAIRYNPVFTQAYLYRGSVLSRFSRYNLANADFDMVIDLRPTSADGYYSRGINFLLTQQIKNSIKDFTEVININPKHVDAWINRGTAKLYNVDSLGALADYTQAIKLSPSYAEAYNKRGRLYFELKNFSLALDDIKKAIEFDSTNPLNFFFRALTYNSIEKIDLALNDLNRAIELSPNNALSIYNRALIYWKKGDLKMALNDLNTVSTLNPENVLVYFNRGVLHYDTDRYKEAINDFSKAIELFPDFANAYLGRSSSYARMGNYYESQRDKSFAQSIAERFSNEHNRPLTDTSQKFNNLIAFNSDFSPRTTIAIVSEFEGRSIDILPFVKAIAVPTENIVRISQNYRPLDIVNESLKSTGVSLKLGSLQSTVDFDSLEIETPFLNALLNGLKFSNVNRYNQAISAYREALKYEKNNSIALLKLSTELADMVSFIASFEKEIGTVNIDQKSKTSTDGLSLGSIPIESFSESIEILEELLHSTSNQYVIYYNLGNIYALSGYLNDAKQFYGKSIDINPSMAEAWYNRGLIHLMQKENIDGCIDMGKAGELGLKQAYLIIHRFCRR